LPKALPEVDKEKIIKLQEYDESTKNTHVEGGHEKKDENEDDDDEDGGHHHHQGPSCAQQ